MNIITFLILDELVLTVLLFVSLKSLCMAF